MAIAKQSTDVTMQTSIASATVNHTLVAGTDRAVICIIQQRAATGAFRPAPTYGGVSMVFAVEATLVDVDHGINISLWYLDEDSLPSTGVKTVDPNFTNTIGGQYHLWLGQFQNIASGGPNQTDNKGEDTPANTTIENTVTAIASTEWAISGVGGGFSFSSYTFTHGQSQVETSDQSGQNSALATAELRGGASETLLESTSNITISSLARVVGVWDEPSAGSTRNRLIVTG